MTCAALEARWGPPNLRETQGTETTLTYKSGFVWAGLMPMLLIPIPLVLPVWRKHTSMICKDGAVVKATGNTTGATGGYCGLTSERPDWGCKWEDD